MHFSQTPPLSSTPTSDENVLRATEFLEFLTQIALGSMDGVSESIPDVNADDSFLVFCSNIKFHIFE